jgi:hypothetical protein
MFSKDELSKLVADAPKYEHCGIIKGGILRLYNEMVFLYDLKAQHRIGLASLQWRGCIVFMMSIDITKIW